MRHFIFINCRYPDDYNLLFINISQEGNRPVIVIEVNTKTDFLLFFYQLLKSIDRCTVLADKYMQLILYFHSLEIDKE